jgi:hypothetical protein
VRVDPLVWVVAAALGAVLLAFPGWVPNTLEPTASVLATVALTDDDGDAALFSSAALRPGRTEQACLTVTAGAASTGPVFLEARIGDAGLAPYLEVAVESGTGGRFGDCTGFVPEGTAFTGTLEQLGVPGGVDTGWQPAAAGSRTFRITAGVADDNAAQGTTASATLVWGVTDAATPAPTTAPPTTAPPTTAPPTTAPPTTAPPTTAPTPVPGPDPTTQPAPSGDDATPSASPSGTPDGTPQVGPDASPEVSPEASPDVSPDPGRGSGAGVSPGGTPGTGTGDGEQARSLTQRFLLTARGLAEHSGFPVLLLAAVFLFFALQNRLDSRDPKLALAPMYPHPTLPFHPPPDPPYALDGGRP